MAHGHGHVSSEREDVPVSATARVVLLGALAVTAVATVLGVVLLWPGPVPHPTGAAGAFAAPGVTFPHATVQSIQKPCPDAAHTATDCGHIAATVSDGAGKGSRVSVQVAPEVSRSGLRRADTIQLLRTPGTGGQAVTYSYFGTSRGWPIAVLLALLVVVVALVARARGLLALVGLAFGAFVLVRFMLPALLTGESGLGVALTGSTAIMFVVLYLAHGLSLRTSAALAGTLSGVALTAGIGLVAVHSARLTGVSSETGSILTTFVGNVSFQGLFTCAVIVAGLGVLNDVTITQASSVWELQAAAPETSRRSLFASAMRIGRDHIASTIYTIVFAYAGTALAVLMLLYFYDRPLLDLLSTEDIAEEIVRTLSSAIGLVLAVPLTTAIAVAVVSPQRQVRRSRGHL